MRAFVLHGPSEASVEDVEAPVVAEHEVVVDVERVGLCGTDVEFFTGEMAYLHQGHARYPMRLGHEWCGIVRKVGSAVSPTLRGRRVMGDTMLGCGECRRCHRGHQHVCETRSEVGIRNGRAGALAEQIAVPASSLHVLPPTVDATLGALVEPGGNSWRAAAASGARRGDSVLVLGPGAIGTLVALFLRAEGVDVHLVGRTADSLEFVRGLGFENAWTRDNVPDIPFDAVVDATNAVDLPAYAAEVVESGGRVVYIGLAGRPSLVDSRTLALKDVTAVGILSASPGLEATITAYAAGRVDPRPLVAATVGLHDVADVLAGRIRPDAGLGPKILVNPSLEEQIS